MAQLSSHYQLPGDDEDTEEQVAYEKEILSQFTHEYALPKVNTPINRVISNSAPAKKSSSFQTYLKGLVRNFKPALKSTAFFLTLDSRFTKDVRNSTFSPEVARRATLRRSLSLSSDEAAFLAARKSRMRQRFSRYLGLNEVDVHPDDIPIIAFGGSGGGYSAMLAFLGYTRAMRDAEL